MAQAMIFSKQAEVDFRDIVEETRAKIAKCVDNGDADGAALEVEAGIAKLNERMALYLLAATTSPTRH